MAPKRRAVKKSTRAQKSGTSMSNDVTREHYKVKQEKLAGFIADFGLAVEEHLAMITNVLNSYLVQVDKAHINLLMKAPGSLLNTNYLKLKNAMKKDDAVSDDGIDTTGETVNRCPEQSLVVNAKATKAELLPSTKAGGGQGSKLISTMKRRQTKKATNITEMKTRLTSQSMKKRTSERLLKAQATPVLGKERYLVPNSTGLSMSVKKYRLSSSMTWTSGVQISQNGEPLNEQPTINLPLADGQVLSCPLDTPLDELIVNLDSKSLHTMTQLRDYLNRICSEVTAMTSPESRPRVP
uniref:Uncharacterized protein LOC116954116 isoform X2 n=1 Tax=Petromyzon marinus TaxID=7757 RepID=A0AAJ7U666_PETMA|nr:uncharacterized protein LOC116954116 isoform X2 [Petromyzon marinus]